MADAAGRVARRRVAVRWLVAALLLVPAVPACDTERGGDREADPARPPAAGSTLRLWRDVAPVEASLPDRAAAPPAVALRLLPPDDSPAGAAFYRVVTRPDGLVYERHAVAAPARLPRESGALRGLVTSVPVREGEALSVRVRVRGQRSGTGPAEPHAPEVAAEVETFVAAFVQRREPFDPDERLDAQAASELFDPAHYAVSYLAGAVPVEWVGPPAASAVGGAGAGAPTGGGGQARPVDGGDPGSGAAIAGVEPAELRLDFLVDVGSVELALYLLPPEKGSALEALLVDEVVVERRTTVDHVLSGGEVPRLWPLGAAGGRESTDRDGTDRDGSDRDGGEHDGPEGDGVAEDGIAGGRTVAGDGTVAAVRASMDRDEREGLLALAPSRFTWELEPSRAERVLDLAVGVRPRHPSIDGAVRYTVRLDDEVLASGTRRAPGDPSEAAWSDLHLPVPPSDAPRRLTIAVDGEGADPPLCVIGHPTLRTPVRDAPPSVVLISLDTLRPDRLGCYGAAALEHSAGGDGAEAHGADGNGAAATQPDDGSGAAANGTGSEERDGPSARLAPAPVSLSPRIDALAAEALRFTNAYSTTSYTLPSHGSLLTGQYPAFHGAVDIADRLSPDRSPFLAQQLARAGYATAAFTGGGYVSTEYGFGHGFDRYSLNDPVWALGTVRGAQLVDTLSWQRSPLTEELLARYDTEAVVAWLERQRPGQPFFVFLHTYVVHNYAPSRAWMERLGLVTPGAAERPFDHRDRTRFNGAAHELPAAERDALRARIVAQYLPYYDATIGMADDFVGAVLDALERAGVADETIVIVTSDHGEEFGEHGFFGHGETLYDANTRIPLVARVPGQPPGVVDDPVSLVDVAPWILRLVGLQPDPRTVGEPPLGPTRASPPARRAIVMELDTHRSRKSALREDDLKLHIDFGGPSHGEPPEELALYDLGADPGETVDLAGRRADAADELRKHLAAFHRLADAAAPRQGGSRALHDLDRDTLIQLLQLGYISADELEAALGARR